MEGPARLSCRAGTARANMSRAGIYLSDTDRLPGLREGGAVETNDWEFESVTATSGGWTLQTLPPV